MCSFKLCIIELIVIYLLHANFVYINGINNVRQIPIALNYFKAILLITVIIYYLLNSKQLSIRN